MILVYFKVYNSVDFSIFTQFCHHHHYLIPDHFITPKRNLIAISSHSPFLPVLDSSLFIDFRGLLKSLGDYPVIHLSVIHVADIFTCQFLYCQGVGKAFLTTT